MEDREEEDGEEDGEEEKKEGKLHEHEKNSLAIILHCDIATTILHIDAF